MSFDYQEAIFTKVKEKLSSSKPLKDFMDADFPGKAISLYDGVLPELKPDSSLYPLVAFSDIERSEKGDDSKENLFIVEMETAILWDTQDGDTDFFDKENIPGTATTPEVNTYKLPGKRKVHEFFTLVVKEVLGIQGLGARISFVGGAAMEDAFPIFTFQGSLSFSFHKSTRSGLRY